MPRFDRPHARCPLCGREINLRVDGRFLLHRHPELPMPCDGGGLTHGEADKLATTYSKVPND